MRQCKRCLLPEGRLNVVLNGEGTCNYCTFYDAHARQLTDYPKLKALLKQKLDSLKGKYSYDAMVGLSGGKDSAYVLYKLVKEYGLHVKAVTYQNGFLTDYARKNVETIVKRMGVDHEYYEPDWNAHKLFYRTALEKLGDPCLACFISGYFIAIKKCHERRIPFFLHGRSPYQMLMNFHEGSQDLFLPIMQMNLRPHSFAGITQVYTKMHEQLKVWVGRLFADPKEAQKVFDEFFLDSSALTGEFAPEFLAFFLFEPYDEEKIKQEMEREVGYRRPPKDGLLTHADCSMHDMAGYVYERVRGLKPVAPEVAVMLRRGDLSREAAEKMLAAEGAGEAAIRESLGCFCGRVGMSEADIQSALARLSKKVPGRFDVG